MKSDPFAWLNPLRAWMAHHCKGATLPMLMFVLLVGITAYVLVFAQALLMMIGVLVQTLFHAARKEWMIVTACLIVLYVWLMLR